MITGFKLGSAQFICLLHSDREAYQGGRHMHIFESTGHGIFAPDGGQVEVAQNAVSS